jgi:hypothetical protein
MRAVHRSVKRSGNWLPRLARGSVRRMRKALLLLAVAAAVAVCLVSFRGRTLWRRAQRDGLPAAASEAMRGALGWFDGRSHRRTSAPATPAAAAARRSPAAGADRILKAPPKERLSPGDRASLDRLVDARSR